MDTMQFRIIIPNDANFDYTFTLPIYGGGASYTQNFVVDWGDTFSSTITSYDDTDRIHTYSTYGTYDILLSGTCEWFCFNNEGSSKSKVTQLQVITGDMGFKKLNFWGCNHLSTIVALGTKASLDTLDNVFRGCYITSIPSSIFASCPTVTSCSGAFSNNEVLDFGATGIPVDLFRYSGCRNLNALPAGIFDYNTLATTFGLAFYKCKLHQTIPGNIFRYCVSLTDLNAAFYGTFLYGHGWGPGTIPSTIIYWTTQPGHSTPTNTKGCFYGSISLSDYTNIPATYKSGF
jgi:hypothetical protein